MAKLGTAVRKAVTRSGNGFRGKFPSRKLKRMIQCESLVEMDAARYFDLHPFVKYFQEQPSVEYYYDKDGCVREYTPDFQLILQNDVEWFVEIKPEDKLARREIKEKFQLISARFEDLQKGYRIFTDVDLRQEPLRSNLKLLAHHGRSRPSNEEINILLQKLPNNCKTIGEIAGAISLRNTYRLIASGVLQFDMTSSLESRTAAWLSAEGEMYGQVFL